MISDIVVKIVKKGGVIYDLGCSTGTLLLEIYQKAPSFYKLIGIDNSEAMLKRASKKAAAYQANIDFILADILDYEFNRCDAFLSSYTLQFIRPIKREKLLQKIYNSLNKNGIFIFSEKIISEDKELNKVMKDIYFNFKKTQGYSDFEIMQKREALENVLIPYSLKENEEIIKGIGFEIFDIIFKFNNFSTFFARK